MQRLILIVLLLLPFGFGQAASVLVDDEPKLGNFEDVSYYRADQENSIAAVLQVPESEWQSIRNEMINFLYDDAAYWLRIPLENQRSGLTDWVLEFGWPFLDSIVLYAVSANNQVIFQRQTGDETAAYSVTSPYRLPHLEFQLKPYESATLYLKVQTQSSLILPMALMEKEHHHVIEVKTQAAMGALFGLLLIMALYNFVISVYTREISYWYYVLYALSVTLYAGCVTGFGQSYLWAGSEWARANMLSLSIALSFFFGAVFLDNFLSLKSRNRVGHQLMNLAKVLYGLLFVGTFLFSEKWIVGIEQPLGIFACTIMFGIFAVEIRKKNPVAKFVLIAWTMLLFGTCIYTLLLLGLIPRTPITENIQMAGIATEMVLLSLALADRINRARIERMATMQALYETSKATYKAEADNKAKTEFFAKMSHEIHTPIGGVLGISELLSNTELDPKQREYVNTIYHSGDALLAIVNDILDFSKIEARKLTLESIPFDLLQLVKECVAIVSVQHKCLELDLVADIASIKHVWFEGDPTRLRQILLNLLGNSVKFTDHGKVGVRVFPCTQAGDEKSSNGHCVSEKQGAVTQLQFEVFDSGIGISEEQQKLLFQPFQQADQTTTRRYGGTGLGLSICKELVELMGGEIGIKSELGQGAVFWFTLPLKEISAPSVADARDETAVNLAGKSTETLRVLVAEDNPVNTVVMAGMLKKLGCRAVFMEDGQQALDSYKAESGDFDLIFMDCEMPVLDGFEACRKIRIFEGSEQLKATPVVALTAHAFGEFRAKAEAFGMSDFLVKPITEKTLRKCFAENAKP